ncbi:MAG: TonB-dependent receptor [Syntrophorhabdales bacterium]
MRLYLGIIVASLMIVSLTPCVRAEDAQAPAGAQVQAQSQQGPSGLPKNYEAYDLGEIYVKGEKLPTAQEVTQTSVVTQEDIEATHSQNVADALSHVPGITITTGAKNQPNVSLQGLNQTETLVLIDGVPYYETNYGLLNLKTIPVDMIDHIEVTKGVSSVLYGPNSLAGVINIITKKPTERPSLDARAEYGDYQASDLSVSHGMKVGMVSYWFGYDRQDSKGWYLSHDFEPQETQLMYKGPGGKTVNEVIENGGVRDNSDFHMDSLWGKVGIEPTPGAEYYLNMNYTSANFGAPASLSQDPIFLFPGQQFSQLWTWPAYNNIGADLSGQQPVTDWMTLKGKLFYHYHEDVGDFYTDPALTQELARSTYKDNTFGGNILDEMSLSSFDTLRANFMYKRDEHQQTSLTYLPFQEAVSYTGSFGVENTWNPVKPLSIVAGVAYDWWDVTKSNQDETNSAGAFTGFENLKTPSADRVDPMVGATYMFDDKTKLFASWAEKIRFPTLQQLYSGNYGGNTNLKPEKADNYVVGASRPLTQYATAEVSFFVHDVADMINRNGPGPTGQYENYGRIFIWGSEVSGQIFPMKDLSFGIGYTYTNATDESPNTPTSRVVYAPTNKVDLTAKYLIPAIKVQTDFTATYIGRTWDQLPYVAQNGPTPALSTGDYFLVGARISRVFYDHFEGYFVVQNLFDRNYEEEIGFPGPGRMLFVGLRYSY